MKRLNYTALGIAQKKKICFEIVVGKININSEIETADIW